MVVELFDNYENEEQPPPAHSMEMAVTAVTQRHAEWDKEFESIEKKEGELLTAQWKLIREQMGLLTRNLAVAQHQLEELKHNSHQALMKVNHNFQINESELKTERNLRLAKEGQLEKDIQQLRSDLESEVKSREAGDTGCAAQVRTKLDAFAEVLDARRQDQFAMEHKLVNLRSSVDSFLPQFDSLRDTMNQDARERKAGEDSLMNTFREHREAVAKESRERDVGHQAVIKSLKGAVEQERADRDLALNPLRLEFQDLQKHFAPHKEDLPKLHTKCKELEETILPKFKDHQKALDNVANEHAVAQRGVEQRMSEMSVKLENETAARHALMEEIEQMLKQHRSKMRSIVNEQAESSRQTRETLASAFQNQLDKEAQVRESQHEELHEHLTNQKVGADTRLDACQKSLADLEGRLSAEMRQEREGGANSAKRAEELARQIRELREYTHSFMSEERAARETALYSLEEQMSVLPRFFQDIGERFIQNGMRRRGAFGTAGSLAPRVLTDSVLTCQTAESHLDATMDSHLDATVRGMPFLTVPDHYSHSEAQLSHVYGNNRVELVMKAANEADTDDLQSRFCEAVLKFHEPIDFKLVHHGDPPLAQFSHEDRAMNVLGDVAEILKVYHTSTVLIEGHTATPAERMDKWAHDLARGRAEMVKSTVASFGIAPERLSTIALPGHLGNNRHDVVLKITSF